MYTCYHNYVIVSDCLVLYVQHFHWILEKLMMLALVLIASCNPTSLIPLNQIICIPLYLIGSSCIEFQMMPPWELISVTYLVPPWELIFIFLHEVVAIYESFNCINLCKWRTWSSEHRNTLFHSWYMCWTWCWSKLIPSPCMWSSNPYIFICQSKTLLSAAIVHVFITTHAPCSIHLPLSKTKLAPHISVELSS